eukprot:1151901-Pelagomonas_calceolata.AAC.4
MALQGEDTNTKALQGKDTNTNALQSTDMNTDALQGEDTNTMALQGKDTNTNALQGTDMNTNALQLRPTPLKENTGLLQAKHHTYFSGEMKHETGKIHEAGQSSERASHPRHQQT